MLRKYDEKGMLFVWKDQNFGDALSGAMHLGGIAWYTSAILNPVSRWGYLENAWSDRA
jgi:hypothetical protein